MHCRDRFRTASKMKVWQGYAHAGVVALSVWFCRETIFEALQWWNGRAPSDGLLLGFCIALTGLACVPIVALHFSHVLVRIVLMEWGYAHSMWLFFFLAVSLARFCTWNTLVRYHSGVFKLPYLLSDLC